MFLLQRLGLVLRLIFFYKGNYSKMSEANRQDRGHEFAQRNKYALYFILAVAIFAIIYNTFIRERPEFYLK